MFGSKKSLKNQIKQLKEENEDLRYELEEQKDITREREKFGMSEFRENSKRRKVLDRIEEILSNNIYNNPDAELAKLKQIKEVIVDKNK